MADPKTRTVTVVLTRVSTNITDVNVRGVYFALRIADAVTGKHIAVISMDEHALADMLTAALAGSTAVMETP